ncbi:protein serine/threonine phosphatase 2C [Wolfiporia cocos MD-104 SS10]|uniref:protein-serine/threonine phosphatase n=1 Tax=Wolfiporia cocos (strain MD-104) TaxID=742152 RepID=A0A2H3J8G3_WOLCO|nr:protein serine/threonine phosphatase 2C [Wolfiporia cocos MD-104 SS10]
MLLGSPITDKATKQGGNDLYHFAITAMQGWRECMSRSSPHYGHSMEDEYSFKLGVDGKQGNANAFFAVYDGHCGCMAAWYATKNLYGWLVEDSAYRNKEYCLALKNAFLSTDEGMRNNPWFQWEDHRDGCTAISALLTVDGKIFVANTGDSRSVLSAKDLATHLSIDHKPKNENERLRITAAGGKIVNGYVNDGLALTRALGDFKYKKNVLLPPEAQIITADPEIIEHDITDDDEFLIVASNEVDSLTKYAKKICDLCLAPEDNRNGVGYDNMTIAVVALLHGRTIDEWYKWIADCTRCRIGFDTPGMLPEVFWTTSRWF